MAGWAPAWVWWCIAIALAVTAQYAVLSQAIELLTRRWARRIGCPVCGAGRDGPPRPPWAGAGRAEKGGGEEP